MILARLYAGTFWPSSIYAAFFEFVFFTGLRLSEALALRWDAVDLDKRVAHVKRTVALGEVVERLKVGNDRFVLLNERAIHALERQAVRRAPESGKGARDRNAVHFPAFEER